MIIYKATNLINGKVYIGQSRISMAERKGSHRRNAFNYNSKIYFHCSIRKHGLDGFKWEIIDKASSLDDLDDKEAYWINYYSSLDKTKGYNLMSGGNGPRHSRSTREKISKFFKGRKITPEQSKARSLRMTGSGNHFHGKSHSKETISKISESRKGKAMGQTEIQKIKCPKRGSDNGRSCISEREARQIKILLLQGIRNKDIKNQFNISKDVVSQIKAGRTWRHVKIWP